MLSSRLTTRDISLITVLTALCIGSDYALVGIPNVKIMDLVVFASGFVFGAPVGVATGALTWMVYGIINPLGFSFPLWLSTIIGETVFGFVGGVLGRINYKTQEKAFNVFRFSLEMGLWGLILTIIYDLFTNMVFAVTFGLPVTAAIVTGWFIPPFFGILHEASNFILFFSALYPLTKVIRTFRGGDRT
ncbi:MAG: ECF transporter S component [Candidatus Bathyarchaeia archaeon]